jgi:hypothetical protein
VAALRKPWDISSGSPDVKPLYSPIIKMSLSEMDADSYYRFGVGSLLAFSHMVGVSHTDLHTDHVPFSELSGLPVFLDSQARFGEVTPGTAVSDFVTPFLSFSPADFHAILIGYINSVYSGTPRSNEYVDEFLQRIGVEAIFDPRPRPFSIDVDQWLSWLGQDLAFSNQSFCLIQSSKEYSPEVWEHPQDLCAIATALLLLDIKCSFLGELRPPKALFERNRVISNLLVTFFKDGRSSEPLNETTPIEIRFVANFFSSMHKLKLEGSQLPGPEVAQTFFDTLKQFPMSSILSFVDKVIDVCDFFAVFADDPNESTEWRQQLSLKAGQLSCLLLGYPAEDLRGDEIRCNTLIQRHNWLISVRELFHDFNDCTTGLQRIAYANSRASVFLTIFDRSCRTNDQKTLNSLRWRGLALNRRGIQSMNRLTKRFSDLRPEQRGVVGTISMVLAGRINKSWLLIPPLRILSSGEGIKNLILSELEWTKAFCEQVKAAGIEHPKSLEMLNDVSALYASDEYKLDDSKESVRNLWR